MGTQASGHSKDYLKKKLFVQVLFDEQRTTGESPENLEVLIARSAEQDMLYLHPKGGTPSHCSYITRDLLTSCARLTSSCVQVTLCAFSGSNALSVQWYMPPIQLACERSFNVKLLG